MLYIDNIKFENSKLSRVYFIFTYDCNVHHVDTNKSTHIEPHLFTNDNRVVHTN